MATSYVSIASRTAVICTTRAKDTRFPVFLRGRGEVWEARWSVRAETTPSARRDSPPRQETSCEIPNQQSPMRRKGLPRGSEPLSPIVYGESPAHQQTTTTTPPRREGGGEGEEGRPLSVRRGASTTSSASRGEGRRDRRRRCRAPRPQKKIVRSKEIERRVDVFSPSYLGSYSSPHSLASSARSRSCSNTNPRRRTDATTRMAGSGP